MKGWAFLTLLICFCQQVWSGVPDKEHLCGLIVDVTLEEECLKCFTDAGPISQYPEKYRACVASFLPPLAAKCAVPHPNGRTARIQQHKPSVHHNHTNANLLPNCLRRRMRDLSRYLMKENRFAKQAGEIVKTVVLSKFIKRGGVYLLGAISQRYILDLPSFKILVQNGASSCIDDYNNARALNRGAFGSKYLSDEDSDEEESEEVDEDEDDLAEALRSLKSDPMWGEKEEEEEEHEDDEEEGYFQTNLRDGPSSQGNGLPYGGTNALAEEMTLGTCIINSLIENDLILHVINIIANDEFYYPIPSWWVKHILTAYKTLREELESDEAH